MCIVIVTRGRHKNLFHNRNCGFLPDPTQPPLRDGHLGPFVPPGPRPGFSPDRPGAEAVSVGPVSVGAPLVGPVAGGGAPSVPDAEGVRLASEDGDTDAAPDGSSEPPAPATSGASESSAGLDARLSVVGDSPAVGPVRPPSPPRVPPEGDPEKANPAIRADRKSVV